MTTPRLVRSADSGSHGGGSPIGASAHSADLLGGRAMEAPRHTGTLELPGTMIGPYKLLEFIAEGGFGHVWLAERRQPMVHRVALKIIKPGMDSKAVVARFEQERQALAVMDHPNVAKVFDGGITPPELGSRPYFVMEHVKGEPITTYCDRQRLTIKQRLELFTLVCEAVQHAHMKGIIHRDIKPSNILVGEQDGKAVPKVIDFGVAKAVSHTLTEKTIFTETGQLIGTPEYMSPEQAEMGAMDIDTRTDVYSLGVVLYELLAGLLPFDPKELRSAGYDAIRKIIREQDAPRPSTRLSTVDGPAAAEIANQRRDQIERLGKELRQELDWIPLKALRKDRGERYESAASLAKDVSRYLDGEALEAGPETSGYRLRKFVRRNQGPIFAVAAVVATLAMGLVGTVSQARRANEKAVAATRAESDQRRLANSERIARQAADAKSHEIEYNSYVANVEMAAAALEFRQNDRVRQRLSACPVWLRGWEWEWLNASADCSLIELIGHTEQVTSAVFSPDGKKIVTASSDHTARVWDSCTGACLATLSRRSVRETAMAPNPNGFDAGAQVNNMVARQPDIEVLADMVDLVQPIPGVDSAVFSPDGSRIATTTRDRVGRVWDSATGLILLQLKGHDGVVMSAAFSPDGTRVVTASADGTARVWNASTGKTLARLKGHTSSVTSAVFSPDGKRVATGSCDGTALLWDASSGVRIARLTGHTGFVHSVAFSSDGTRILTVDDESARLWHAESGTRLLDLRGHAGNTYSAAFSPDGRRVVTASSDHTARVWDTDTGVCIAVLSGHLGWVHSASFSPDGSRIVTASDDQTSRVWDASTGVCLSELRGHTKRVRSVSFGPDGTRIVTASLDNTARVWDGINGATTGIELKDHTDCVTAAAFSPNGSEVATSSHDQSVRLWSVTTAAPLAEFKEHTGEVNSVAFSSDGKRVVTASRDNTARVWDVATGVAVAVLRGHKDEVTSAAFSPDGTRVVTASRDGTARVWDSMNGVFQLELKGHSYIVCSAAFSPDGTRIVTASSDESARVWDAASGTTLVQLKGHMGAVSSAVYSSDGKRIVTASFDKSARVWDAVTGASKFELCGHTEHVNGASFSSDGKRIVTASLDKTARVWDATTGVCLAELRGHRSGVTSASFSPNGVWIVTTSWDHTARLWSSVPYRSQFGEIQQARAAKAQSPNHSSPPK